MEKTTIENQVRNSNSRGFSAIPCAVVVIANTRMNNSVYVAFIVTSPCRSVFEYINCSNSRSVIVSIAANSSPELSSLSGNDRR